MQFDWLMNLSLAIEGSRVLKSGRAFTMPAHQWLSDLDFEPLGVSLDGWLSQLEAKGVDGIELQWAGVHRPIPPSERNSSFVVAANPTAERWKVVSTIAGLFSKWSFRLEAIDPYVGDERDSPTRDVAERDLRELLVTMSTRDADGPFTQSLHLLTGEVDLPTEIFGIEIDHLAYDERRILAATISLASGKLSGMGGLDDVYETPPDMVDIVGRAMAAATQVHTYGGH